MKSPLRVILGLTAIVLIAGFWSAPESLWRAQRLLSSFGLEPSLTEESLASVQFIATDPDMLIRSPSFSPDGRFIVFSRGFRFNPNHQLFVMPTDGGDARMLTQATLPVSASRPAWSKQGDLIVFTGTDANNANSIWLINADGSNPHQLELDGLSDRVFYPSWHPDGQHLIVVDGHDNVIKRIDIQQGTVENLTDASKVYAGKPSISPAGDWIAFAGQKNIGQKYEKSINSIWLIDDNGSPRILELNSEQSRHATWSPDGTQLAFDSTRGLLTAVYTINRDGSGLKRVTDYALRACEPVWSPDGKQLLVLAKYREEAGPFGFAKVNL